MNTIEQNLLPTFRNNARILSLATSIQCTISIQCCTGNLTMVTSKRKGALRQKRSKSYLFWLQFKENTGKVLKLNKVRQLNL